MKKLAACLLIISTPVAAMAAPPVTYEPIEQCWEPPTERESGEVLPLEEIYGYVISYKHTGSTSFTQISGEILSPTTCVTFVPTLADEVCFIGNTIDTDGLISDDADPVCKLPVAIDRRPKPFNWRALTNILK